MVTEGSPLLLPRGTRNADQRRWLEQRRPARPSPSPPGSRRHPGRPRRHRPPRDVRTYDDDDVRLLETVANQAGVALQNGELVDQLRHDALHDALTGLPNRAALRHELGAALAG